MPSVPMRSRSELPLGNEKNANAPPALLRLAFLPVSQTMNEEDLLREAPHGRRRVVRQQG